jgi:hypothetical protein
MATGATRAQQRAGVSDAVGEGVMGVQVALLRLLLEAGADTTARDTYQLTALEVARHSNKQEAARVLSEAAAAAAAAEQRVGHTQGVDGDGEAAEEPRRRGRARARRGKAASAQGGVSGGGEEVQAETGVLVPGSQPRGEVESAPGRKLRWRHLSQQGGCGGGGGG